MNEEWIEMAKDDELRPILTRGLDAQNEVMLADAELKSALAERARAEAGREDERLRIAGDHLALAIESHHKGRVHDGWVREHIERSNALYERIAAALERLAPPAAITEAEG